jgi:hypothetical protein
MANGIVHSISLKIPWLRGPVQRVRSAPDAAPPASPRRSPSTGGVQIGASNLRKDGCASGY